MINAKSFFISLVIIFNSLELFAQDLLNYNCSAVKVTMTPEGHLAGIETVGTVSGTKSLIPYAPPFGSYVDQPVTLDQTNSIKSDILIEGNNVSVQNTLSFILTRPSAANPTKWGICQAAMHLSTQKQSGLTLTIKNLGAANLYGAKSLSTGETSCQSLTIEANNEFNLTVSDTLMSTTLEKFSYACAFKVTPTKSSRIRPILVPIF